MFNGTGGWKVNYMHDNFHECKMCELNEKRGDKEREHKEHDHKHNLDSLYALLFSAIFYAIGLILKFLLGFDGIVTISFFTVSYILVGFKIIKLAFKGLLVGDIFNENFLLTVATLGAFAIMEYPEATGVMLFYRIGEYLQDRALDKSRRSIRSLLKLKADYANLKKNGKIVKVRPEEVGVGELILIRPGERIPLDGVIVKGHSVVDTSALTGESIPREVKTGDQVLSGMINLSGLLLVKVTKEFKESTVARILRLVEEASARKARVEKFITRFARYYTPAVVGLAALIAFIPPIVTGASLTLWVYRALVLLVISCPCALVLSIPLGYFGGLGRSAKEGILVKGSNFLDLMANLKIMAIDKTGTLTKGTFKVSKVVPQNGFNKEELLYYAALAESYSNHPIARAIREAYPGEVVKEKVKEYKEITGHGVKARVDSTLILVGNDKLLHREHVEHEVCDVAGGTIVYVVVNKTYAGYIVISDEIKEEAPLAIKELKELGVEKLLMLTGDSRHVARIVAEKLGIDEYYAELLPEDKVRLIEELCLKDKKQVVVFVGDGVNDAPVIARADIGIAMGALGSDAAIEVADLVIMDDNLMKLPKAIRIARKTRSIVFQNIILALVVKLFFLGLGIVGEATMWEALFADVGVALVTVLNAMRILK
ncbi:MAG: cadmium-translocating P-type ATPase [Thermoprotei archaeon]|nr:MAG: cadmium-translocating P-type ATPase [Thermoprotei archaeon]